MAKNGRELSVAERERLLASWMDDLESAELFAEQMLSGLKTALFALKRGEDRSLQLNSVKAAFFTSGRCREVLEGVALSMMKELRPPSVPPMFEDCE